MNEQRVPAFLATVYHDEPEDAATNSRSEWRHSLDDAVSWAREKTWSDPYWNGAPSTVHAGFVVRTTDRIAPPRWEDDDDGHLWLVYADSMEQER